MAEGAAGARDGAAERLRALLQQAAAAEHVSAEDLELVSSNVQLLLDRGLVTDRVLRSASKQELVQSGIALGVATALKFIFPEPGEFTACQSWAN